MTWLFMVLNIFTSRTSGNAALQLLRQRVGVADEE